MVAQVVQSGALAGPPGDEDGRRAATRRRRHFGSACSRSCACKAYDQLAAAVLDPAGQPRVRWWPVAFALQRLEDKRALTALLTLARDANPYTRAFAVKGLGGLKAVAAGPARLACRRSLIPLLASGERADRDRGGARARPDRRSGGGARPAEDHAGPEGGAASAARGGRGVGRASGRRASTTLLLDLLSDPSPDVRAAALRSSAAQSIPRTSSPCSPGSIPIRNWIVRAALAAVLGTLPPDVALPRLTAMLKDSDQRVIPAVLDGAGQASRARTCRRVLLERLKAEDPAVRAAAAARSRRDQAAERRGGAGRGLRVGPARR